ncbi:unnamed protein product, partial [marine sediment metagenome]
DAGSVVLASQFFSPDMDPNQYQEVYPEYIKEIGKEYFPPNRLRKITNQFIKWGIGFNFLYMTDAAKVYKEGSWNNWDFNREKSKELLEKEIEFCKPDLIVLLGDSPLSLLDKTKDYGSVVESRKLLLIKGRKCIVAPFFIGNGPVGNRHGKGFDKRLEIASNLIKKLIKLC